MRDGVPRRQPLRAFRVGIDEGHDSRALDAPQGGKMLVLADLAATNERDPRAWLRIHISPGSVTNEAPGHSAG